MNGSEESGVKSLFDISFTDATMKIPTFVVEDYTERLFRNLIAYELYEEGSTYVIDYVTLMDNLINSAKDVQLLRFHGIIENMLGNDEAVAQMLNKLRDHVMFCGDTFYYEEIFVDVKTHCARPSTFENSFPFESVKTTTIVSSAQDANIEALQPSSFLTSEVSSIKCPSVFKLNSN
ncbi:Protein of unknown function DUF247 [Theobroma cacao]|nr:Protein of unknown function DUF247 [Theobroma cacao]